MLRKPVLAVLLAALALPAAAAASPRFRLDAGTVPAPLDTVPYLYVIAPGGIPYQNVCQSQAAGGYCAPAPPNTHWDYSDPAHPVFVDDDPTSSRCFWFAAENPFGTGIPGSPFSISATLIDPSGAGTPTTADLPQVPGLLNNPQIDLGGSGPGAASRATCTLQSVLPGQDDGDLEPIETELPARTPPKTSKKTKRPERPTRRKPSRPSRGGTGGGYASKVCGQVPANVNCADGAGRQTSGGGEKVSHKGWPAVTGVLWKVLDSSSRRKTGGSLNDELLGHHGSDRLNGAAGDDVLWGDWDPSDNNSRQHDTLIGGTGDDFIYPSHGTTVVKAGPGKDYIWAFYGKGTIDCGAGYDTVRVRTNGAFHLRNCEVVGHFCQYGSNGNGGCKKPGERAKLD